MENSGTYEAACETARTNIAALFAQVQPTPSDAWVAARTDAVMQPLEAVGDEPRLAGPS
jgi:hypothetical protein